MSKPKAQHKAPSQKKKVQAPLPQKKVSFIHGHALEVLIGLCLFGVALAVFWPVKNHEFVNFDDDRYVTDNFHVKAGLTPKGVIWAFTTTHTGNWHPMTWLSHMLDCELYGLNAGGHHLTSLLFHIMNTVLLFLLFKRMTGGLWKSSFVAALFALHPLHVESVAWVAERKDVLSTLFWMLTMWTYVWYTKQPGIGRYLLSVLFFALGLLSKPMLVTLPFVLLLLDYWPLGRFRMELASGHQKPRGSKPTDPGNPRSLIFRRVAEKGPFFALSAASSLVTFFVQQKAGSVKSFELFPLGARIGNALVSYVDYIVKMIWPQSLAVLYPHSGMLPLWQVVGVGLLLVCVSIVAIRFARRHPYLVVGWLWYLGTLVPVVGLVQVGTQAMADRYTYIPLIGLFVVIAWGIPDLLSGLRYRRTLLATSAGLVLLIFTIVTMLHVRHWRNSITLFEHALKVTVNNYVIQTNLGFALAALGRNEEAAAHYVEALRINPYIAEARINLGNVLVQQKKYQEAINHYTETIRIMPELAEAHSNLGVVLADQGRYQEAMAHYAEALRIKPDNADAHYNLGNALMHQGKYQEAIDHYTESLRNKPGMADVHNSLGVALGRQGKYQEAMAQYEEALRIKPDYVEAYYNLGNALVRQARYQEAIAHFTKALRIAPDFPGAHFSLGLVYLTMGDRGAAKKEYEILQKIHPGLANTLGQKMMK